MKKFILTLSFVVVVFSSSCFAIGNFNSETGILDLRNISVDGISTYDKVKLQLNLATGNFTILDTTLNPIVPELLKTFSETPLHTFISDDSEVKIDFMGCVLSAKDLGLRQNQVMCKTDVVSLKSDQEIITVGENNLIDNLGNGYFRQLTIVALDKSDAGIAKFNAIQGVSVSVIYVFNGIDFGATSISTFNSSFFIRQTTSQINPSFTVDLKLPTD